MARFGKWQTSSSNALAKLGIIGRLYGRIVGYTQVGGYARSILFKKVLARFKPPFTDVLDLGCGTGDYVLYMAETYPKARIVGTDLSRQCIETLLSTCKQAGFQNVSAIVRSHLELRDREQYDFAYSIDSLQYIKEKREVVERLFAALRPGGHLLMRIPLADQVRLLPDRLFEDHEQEEGWRRNEAIRPHYDCASLGADLASVGFEIRHLTYTTGFWGRLSFESSHVVGGMSRVLYALLLPVFKLFGYLDTLMLDKRSGDGLIVLCRKPA